MYHVQRRTADTGRERSESAGGDETGIGEGKYKKESHGDHAASMYHMQRRTADTGRERSKSAGEDETSIGERKYKMDFRENFKNSIDKCRKFAYNKKECRSSCLHNKSEKRSSKSNSYLR